MPKHVTKFDPEGSGFDHETARREGLGPDASGHFPSRVPRTGQLLKGRNHPTFQKTLDAEKRLGFTVRKGKGGRFFSNKRRRTNPLARGVQ